MRKLAAAATLVALAMAVAGRNGSAVPAGRVAQNRSSVMIVPYFTVVGGIRGSNSVSAYTIDAITGVLTPAAGSPFKAAQNPSAVALGPGGRFAYVVNKDSDSVSVYEVNASTGALTPVAGSPFAAGSGGSNPDDITIDPAGKYAYAASDAGVFAFSINASTGALIRVPGSPFAAGQSNGFGTASIAVAPSERFAYVLNHANNTVSVYAIDATGALKPAGSPLDAGQNSNDLASFNSVRVDPRGKFAYVTSQNRVYVYAIDATSGALAPPAHLGLGVIDGDLTGFALDPTGKFAYAVDGSRIYAYTINSTSGLLKAVASKKFALSAGTYASGVTIDPTSTFAYVLNPGSLHTAPMIFAYRIAPSTGELTPLAGSPFALATSPDRIARWFESGRCAAFAAGFGADTAPLAKPGSESVIFDRITANTRGYFYDPKSRVALHYPETDSDGTFTLRESGPPPAAVTRHDLSNLHTASGIKLGSSSESVVRLAGKPKIFSGCGLQRYVYLRSREGEPTSIEFTIDGGRVTEIFEDFGG